MKDNTMNKEELTEIIARECGLPKNQTSKLIQTLLSTIMDKVIEGDKVTLAGFGTFQATEYKGRMGRSIATGEPLIIEAVRRPKFQPGIPFKKAVKDYTVTRLEH
jgi:DNA-binding protein HU-beta